MKNSEGSPEVKGQIRRRQREILNNKMMGKVKDADVVITNPTSRILPIVLGIFGYTYGSLLGVFLLGALTKTRGSDRGNLIAMVAGFLAVAILSGLPSDLLKLCGLPPLPRPDWLPLIAFPWRITFGTLVTFFVGFLFRPKPVSS
jgi:Na+/proline symporter